MYEDRVIQLCSDYAAIAHKFQLRKDGKTPYISHPGRVALFAATYGRMYFISICAAWLHDVMEDVAVGPFGCKGYPFMIQNHTDRYRDIRLFLLDNPDIKPADGKEILRLVTILTMSQDKSIPKKTRKRQYIDNIAKESVDASVLKYCDRLDNLTTCHIFTKNGFAWYLEDTQMIIDKLGPKVKAVNPITHLELERKLDEVKKTYEKMYGNK